MHILIWTIIIVYGALILFIFTYSIVQLTLTLGYRKSRKRNEVQVPNALVIFPNVTIQLPIFNEKYVSERLIDSTAAIDYPKDKLEIQVLDDSTDETFELVANKVGELQQKGYNIKHIHRVKRVGYKAGALAEGLEVCEGEFVAIFDADFLPAKNFLMDSLKYFVHDKIGLVQTKWVHLNKNYNLLTRLQAFGLDAHFTVEQGGRNAAGHFMNFNGTAGIWRKTCIEDAGGWHSDTLTEDLDLSYRAQLKGWSFKYVEDIGSPAELPAAMNALKTQQYRWNKGAAECAVKNLDKVIKSKNVSNSTKVHAIFHLMNSFLFVCILLTGLLSVPLMWVKSTYFQYGYLFQIAAIFSVSFVFLAFFYWTSAAMNYENKRLGFLKFISSFPLFLSVYMGLSLHNAIAVFEGYAGRKSPFVRTPKFNVVKKEEGWKNNKYISKQINPLTYIELLLALYFAFAIWAGFYLGDSGLMPFHVMLMFGFGVIGLYSVRHAKG
mgnify:FL=1